MATAARSDTGNPLAEGPRPCPRDVRWTGVLRQLLGQVPYIIEGCGEEGYTVFDENELSYGRNGLKCLVPAFASHNHWI